jgi:hypothetical protein
MPLNRYSNQKMINSAQYGTYDKRIEGGGYTELNLLKGVRFFEYTLQRGERLDIVANKLLGDDSYWWVIALVNNIHYPLGVEAGTKISVPYNVKDVLDKIS